MIWGDIVNQVRNLHADFFDVFQPQVKEFQLVELDSEAFPYPEPTGEFGEWEPVLESHPRVESLELHPVERVLLEGPLLPIQEVTVSVQQWSRLQNDILKLEKQFLQQTKTNQPEKIEFIEKNLHARFMQLQRRTGQQTLKAL